MQRAHCSRALYASAAISGRRRPYALSHLGRDRGLAFQATLPVQPADKRLSLVLRSGLMIGPSLIERFDSDEASDLLARKTHVRELPHVRHGGELLSEFHSHPPVSLSRLLRAVGLPTSASSSSIRTSIGLPECSDPGLK